jgi:selenocysteine-specific elongation factor
MRTLGGGTLLGGWARRADRNDAAFCAYLDAVAVRDLDAMIAYRCVSNKQEPLLLHAFATEFRVPLDEVQRTAEQESIHPLSSGWVVSAKGFDAATALLEGRTAEWREAHPTSAGIPEDPLIEGLHPRLGRAALDALLAQGRLVSIQGAVQLPKSDGAADISEEDRETLSEIEGAFRDAGLRVPGMVEVLRNDKRRMALYRRLVDARVLMPIVLANKPRTPANTVVFHRDVLDDTRAALRDRFGGDPFSMGDMKELLGITRKYLVPLAEHLDETRFTRREGDTRRIVETAK